MAHAKPNLQLIVWANQSLTPPGALLTKLVPLLLLASLLLTGCQEAATRPDQTPAGPSNQVTAVGYPLSFFAEQLVDESIKIHAVLPKQGSLASWRPSRDEILSMQKSDIIFINGSAAPFASWLPHVTLPESKVCATANDGLKLSDMISVEDIRIVHSHGPEGEHSHPTMVAYTWLDPAIAAKQVAIMAKRLTTTYPKLKSSIADKQQKLTGELKKLSKAVKTVNLHLALKKISIEEKSPTTMLTDSPNLKFLTRVLGVNDIHLNWSKGLSTSEAEIQLKEKLSSLASRPEFMLFADEPTAELRSVAESFQLNVIVMNSMASATSDSNYFHVMSENLNRLKPTYEIEVKDKIRPKHKNDAEQAKPNASAPEQN